MKKKSQTIASKIEALKEMSQTNESHANLPAIPWEIFELLQREQNKESSSLWVNGNVLISWAYDCLLGKCNSQDISLPLNETDILEIRNEFNETAKSLENWIALMRNALQLKPRQYIIEGNDNICFEALCGASKKGNIEFLENTYLTKFFCKNGEFPSNAFIKSADGNEGFFFIDIKKTIKRKESFYKSGKEIAENGFESNLFKLAVEQEQVLKLTKNFLFDVPEMAQKYIFGTLISHSYFDDYPQKTNSSLFVFDNLPLEFVPTENSIKIFEKNRDGTLFEIENDKDALKAVSPWTPTGLKHSLIFVSDNPEPVQNSPKPFSSRKMHF